MAKMNSNHCVWSPIAILPNLTAGRSIDGGVVAFAGADDPRVKAICQNAPKFAKMLGRFTDAFKARLDPVAFIARDDVLASLSADALLSFRDLVAMSVIPYSRSLNTVRGTTNRIVYSMWFWIYPWTLSNNNEELITRTPAQTGWHDVDAFYGQSSPELAPMRIKEWDAPLFEALLTCWRRHYLGTRKRWKDRALFRSLNMAFQAASFPAGVGTNIFDLGRSISLWVSALEILSHPGNAKADLLTVYPLFEKVSYYDRKVGRRQYAAYLPRGRKGSNVGRLRRPLPCWIYGKLYQARNHFLHGNRVSAATLSPKGSKHGLFWLAAPLYRLGLSGFLGLTIDLQLPYRLSNAHDIDPKLYVARDKQQMNERALLRIFKS
jgi:hypothetical protein